MSGNKSIVGWLYVCVRGGGSIPVPLYGKWTYPAAGLGGAASEGKP